MRLRDRPVNENRTLKQTDCDVSEVSLVTLCVVRFGFKMKLITIFIISSVFLEANGLGPAILAVAAKSILSATGTAFYTYGGERGKKVSAALKITLDVLNVVFGISPACETQNDNSERLDEMAATLKLTEKKVRR